MNVCGQHVRRDEPVLFVEQLAIADGLRRGDLISAIAFRLRRPITQVRRLAYGEEA